ncbi:putative six-hairpin glycosidase superfamily, alpha-L-rhamnosidase domain-containing protein [Septoria linicola]|nr:putative six-hairpin glycosidase superfamily, alpha-L-rhamnosidase domain-containing protein [Septoria linicola]
MDRQSLALLLPALAACFVDYGDVLPSTYSAGHTHVLGNGGPYGNQTITLSPDTPVLTIDYGAEVAGFPFFEVQNQSAATQIEVKYAEDFTAFDNPYSDGPWTFSNGLSNSFRTETFNLTGAGRQQSFFVQGGQRLKLTSDNKPAAAFTGRLDTSSDLYNKIWDLGPRVVQAACIDAGNASSTWETTPEGALIRGQQTAQSSNGSKFANYTLSFMTKIVRGGTGWRLASGSVAVPRGHILYMTSEYPEATIFVNTNRTLVPPNTLIYNYGYSIVNQSTLTTGWNQQIPIHVTIQENVWYNISTTLTPTSINVSLDSQLIASISQDESIALSDQGASYLGTSSTTGGTFGFGPWADQVAYYKDVLVTAQNGSVLYSNQLTSNDTLAEYNVAELDASVCLDGAKRDRLVWAGDFYHTTRVLGSSTARWDYILGSIDYVLSYQRKPGQSTAGFVPISAALGSRLEYADALAGSGFSALVDYQDLFLAAIGHYFLATADIEGLRPKWEQIKLLFEERMKYIDPYSGLMAGEDAFYFLGPSLIPLAEALNDTATATTLSETSNGLIENLNSKLWNASAGVYAYSLEQPGDFSFTGIAWGILAGASNSSQAASSIARLPELRLGVRYKTSTVDESTNTTQLSPNTGGFLLEALFKAERDLGVKNLTVAKSMLDDLWSNMVTCDEYHSGASWEYEYPDGRPGIDLFTSLAHPWGAAPTYVLPEYVLGVTALTPGFRTWSFEPLIGSLGLKEANGTTWTPSGPIVAGWKIVDGIAVVSATAPNGTTGVLVLPDGASKRRIELPSGCDTQIRAHTW